VKAAVIALLTSLLSCGLGFACTVDSGVYDQNPPQAFKGTVRNQFARFDWGSDVEPTATGPHRIWNFLHNQSDKSLKFKWPKGGISQTGWGPLPPDEINCSYSFTTQVLYDSQAPLTYGTNDRVENTAVYVQPPDSPSISPLDNGAAPRQGAQAQSPLDSTNPAGRPITDGVFEKAGCLGGSDVLLEIYQSRCG
jgi:hypothetical protein